jgi:hypothetical protein
MARKLKNPSLETMADLAAETLRLYEDSRDGLRDPGDASKLAGILKTAGDLKQASDLEGKVADLQKRLKDRERT